MKYAKHVGSLTPPSVEILHEVKESTRLNKYISESGFASRRGADRLIEMGDVYVNDILATVGQQVGPGDRVRFKDSDISNQKQRIYIALNKPTGITSTTNLEDESNMIDFMNYSETIFPIGRLDKDSSGLILLTNDGNVVNKILRFENQHDKQYRVSVNKAYDASFLSAMASGVLIYNQKQHRNETTQPCQVVGVDAKTFIITLHQGLNRQIRRMTKALGYKTVTLKRERIMNINLSGLNVGEWRYLTHDEIETLNAILR